MLKYSQNHSFYLRDYAWFWIFQTVQLNPLITQLLSALSTFRSYWVPTWTTHKMEVLHLGGLISSLKDICFRRTWTLSASLVAQRLKHLPAMQENWVRSLGWEDCLEKEMATHSSILDWRVPWMEEPGGLQSMGWQSQTRLSYSIWTTHKMEVLRLGGLTSSLKDICFRRTWTLLEETVSIYIFR